MIEPKINLVAYRALGGGKKIFVMVPNEANRWLKTELCVAYIGCLQCGALVGEPCYDFKRFNTYQNKKYTSTIHCARRRSYKKGKK
jgi:hypothetical protein